MRILIYLILYLLLPSFATAGSCKSNQSESFVTFFDKFSSEKEFALSRTIYPLKFKKWEHGLDEKGNDASSPTLKFITKKEEEKGSSLSYYMKKNSLDFEITENLEDSAKVKIYKEGTDWMMDYHFMNKSNCWFLREIEDFSL